MNAPNQALHNRVDAVLALAASRLDAQRAQAVESVAREYFNRVDPDDLAERTPEDLLGTVLSHLQLGDMREPGHPKVRIFAPTPGEDGWTSRHTVIQIVNDDMPFLVDSVANAIAAFEPVTMVAAPALRDWLAGTEPSSRKNKPRRATSPSSVSPRRDSAG